MNSEHIVCHCPKCHARYVRNERCARQLIYWYIWKEMDDVDELSPEALDVVDHFRKPWTSTTEFNANYQDADAIREFMAQRQGVTR